MTIAASGPLRVANISTEYGGTGARRLGSYYRGGSLVLKNANDNVSVNGSAGVPISGPLRMSHFYSQKIGYTYTTVANHANHYHCHTEFGADWAGNAWPKRYINNHVIGSTSVNTYALVIYGGTGPFIFENNNEIQGAYGSPNSGAGQHAIYIYNTTAADRCHIINNWAIRGGGGAGGVGGVGGTGGPGYYYYTAQEGPAYAQNSYHYYRQMAGSSPTYLQVYWGGVQVYPLTFQGNTGGAMPGIGVGGYTYYPYQLAAQIQQFRYWYSVYRQWTAVAYTGGGGGGAGGNGGYGVGYGHGGASSGGIGGSPGAAGGANAGSGGYGGTGGGGGTWGAPGGTGGTGATGNGGNNGGGYAGGGGGGGGAAGYCIYAATPWRLTNNNTLNGPYGGGVAPT